MKTIVRLVCILSVAVLFSACRKEIYVPDPPAVNPLSGSWVVSTADENDGNGWFPFSPSYGNGVFDFYDQGSAKYSDANATLTGSWYIANAANSYYDDYGNLYTGPHQSLEMQMADSYSGSTLSLYFDYITFENPNLFTATYFNGKYIERISFSRY